MERVKIPQEIINQVKQLQQNNQAVITELGQIELQKIRIKQRRTEAEQILNTLQEEEKTLAEFLESSYGKGTLDIDKGEFIPLT